jgi:hypothetical protein
MATSRPFAYNTGSTISGTEQIGDLAIGVDDLDYDGGVGGVTWWNGPDEDLGYVICRPNVTGNQPNPVGIPAYIRFLRSKFKTEESFVNLVNIVFNQTFTTGDECKTYLNNNGFWTSWVSNIKLYLDASNPSSYSGAGTTWYDLSGNGNDVEMVNSGSITWNNSGPTYFSTGSNGWFSNPSGTNLPVGNSNYTFIIWVQLGTSWNSNGFMSIGPFGGGNQANAFRAGTTNQIINYWWGNDLSVITSVSPTNGWFNAVAKYDGTTRSIWVNGVLVNSDTPVGHNVTTSALQIAKTTSIEYLQGNVGEVLIYDIALSDSSILQYYNNTYTKYINVTPTPTPTVTPTFTPTPTPTVTPTPTPTATPTPTPSTSPFITSGLILNYNINSLSSYPGSGTTIIDLQGNSNATTFNSPTYTSSGGGYLTFNGSNQYFVTNTALGSKLNPANTSTIISIFVWVYPMDNGVIVQEIGQSSPNAGWHDSQIEMVSGTLRFSVWQNQPGFASTIPTPLNNWYYVGFTYDGTNLIGYVNGSLAVTSGTISRLTPGANLYYAIASEDGTNLGDGSYANMRFGGMQVYNTALSGPNVLSNYNSQKSRFGL